MAPRFAVRGVLARPVLDGYLARVAARPDASFPGMSELIGRARSGDIARLNVSEAQAVQTPIAAFVRGLTLLAQKPDTHIARRVDRAAAEQVSARARAVLEAGGVRSAAGRRAIDDMDRALRDARHTLNPGTTADLTTAAIFVVLLARGYRT